MTDEKMDLKMNIMNETINTMLTQLSDLQLQDLKFWMESKYAEIVRKLN